MTTALLPASSIACSMVDGRPTHSITVLIQIIPAALRQSASSRLPCPCHLEHDSKSAAARIHQGTSMHSGVIEHMCINPDGPLCYCGNRGCLETYCSANSLEESSGLPVKEFFPALREDKDARLRQIWEDYLKHLAFAMRNMNMVIDAPIIISGYLAPYFTEEDIGRLLEHINAASPFALERDQILVGTHGQYTPAVGAALYFVNEFIRSV